MVASPRQDFLDRIQAIVTEADVPGICLVGIDGPAGSGKSTAAQWLSDRFRWPVIEIDDFFSWVSFDDWWPRFESEVIEPLLAGRSIRYQVRDWAGDEFGDGLGGWKQLDWSPTIIIEGVGCTRVSVASDLACRVWVDAPAEERLARGVMRDGESHRSLWTNYLTREASFFEVDQTAARADIRLDTGGR